VKKLFYLPVFCLVGIALAVSDAAAGDDYVAAARTIRANLARAHEIIVELSGIAESDADKRAVATLVGLQQKLEAELVEFDKIAAAGTKAAANIQESTDAVNKAVRLYNSKCRGSTHPACVKLRNAIASDRAKIEKVRPALEKLRAWSAEFLDRSGRWRSTLEADLKRIKKLIEDTAPLEELPEANAARFAGIAASPQTNLEATSALASSERGSLEVADMADAVPEGIESSGEGAALPEVRADESTGPTWRWERVRVRRSFGPFCWTQCCWRKVQVAR